MDCISLRMVDCGTAARTFCLRAEMILTPRSGSAWQQGASAARWPTLRGINRRVFGVSIIRYQGRQIA